MNFYTYISPESIEQISSFATY